MSENFTLNDLADFYKNEQTMLNDLFGTKKNEHNSPKKQTIQNILNYSKALSVRKSDNLGHLEFVLN